MSGGGRRLPPSDWYRGLLASAEPRRVVCTGRAVWSPAHCYCTHVEHTLCVHCSGLQLAFAHTVVVCAVLHRVVCPRTHRPFVVKLCCTVLHGELALAHTQLSGVQRYIGNKAVLPHTRPGCNMGGAILGQCALAHTYNLLLCTGVQRELGASATYFEYFLRIFVVWPATGRVVAFMLCIQCSDSSPVHSLTFCALVRSFGLPHARHVVQYAVCVLCEGL